MSNKEDAFRLLQEAHDMRNKASGLLDNALKAWLELYNFPSEIEQGFDIGFASSGENIVTYYGRGEFEEWQLEDLIGKSYDEVIKIFNC